MNIRRIKKKNEKNIQYTRIDKRDVLFELLANISNISAVCHNNHSYTLYRKIRDGIMDIVLFC